jgi:hypothetical protein
MHFPVAATHKKVRVALLVHQAPAPWPIFAAFD